MADIDRAVLGTWGLSGAWGMEGAPMGYGAVTEAQAMAVFEAAHACGIRRVDTCASYGGGEGIARLRRWQRCGRRFQPILKIGRPLIDGAPASRLDEDSLIEEAAWQIDALGPPAAILIKDPPLEALVDGTVLRRMDALANAFPDTRVGIASHRLEALDRLVPGTEGAIAQIELHALNRWRSVPAAVSLRDRGWTVWAMQPLAYGFLGGRIEVDHEFAADDWRRRIPLAQRQIYVLGAHGFSSTLAPRFPGATMAQLALAFCLACPAVAQVVVGPKHPRHLADVMIALELAEDRGFHTAVAELI